MLARLHFTNHAISPALHMRIQTRVSILFVLAPSARSFTSTKTRVIMNELISSLSLWRLEKFKIKVLADPASSEDMIPGSQKATSQSECFHVAQGLMGPRWASFTGTNLILDGRSTLVTSSPRNSSPSYCQHLVVGCQDVNWERTPTLTVKQAHNVCRVELRTCSTAPAYIREAFLRETYETRTE